MVGPVAMTGWLVVVSAAARPPVIRLAGRMRASRRLMAATGRLGVFVFRRMISGTPFPQES